MTGYTLPPYLTRRLYHHSHQTFLSMTAQRALHSASRSSLYPDTQATRPPVPLSPIRKGHARDASVASTASRVEEGPIVFREVGKEEQARLLNGLKRSLGG